MAELTGTLNQVLPSLSGQTSQGKNWKKQEFIIETIEEYPRKICITAWNNDCRLLDTLSPGDVLVVKINIESREYENRWYTEVKAWKIELKAKS